VSTEEGAIGDVWLTGVARVLDPVTRGDSQAPLAVLPLTFDGGTVGVIAVNKLLPHKQAWAPVDHELFKLLSAHGATALIAANLYEREDGVRSALQDVSQHLDETLQPSAEAKRAETVLADARLAETKVGSEP
jgi:GAF domain-containing protein